MIWYENEYNIKDDVLLSYDQKRGLPGKKVHIVLRPFQEKLNYEFLFFSFALRDLYLEYEIKIERYVFDFNGMFYHLHFLIDVDILFSFFEYLQHLHRNYMVACYKDLTCSYSFFIWVKRFDFLEDIRYEACLINIKNYIECKVFDYNSWKHNYFSIPVVRGVQKVLTMNRVFNARLFFLQEQMEYYMLGYLLDGCCAIIKPDFDIKMGEKITINYKYSTLLKERFAILPVLINRYFSFFVYLFLIRIRLVISKDPTSPISLFFISNGLDSINLFQFFTDVFDIGDPSVLFSEQDMLFNLYKCSLTVVKMSELINVVLSKEGLVVKNFFYGEKDTYSLFLEFVCKLYQIYHNICSVLVKSIDVMISRYKLVTHISTFLLELFNLRQADIMSSFQSEFVEEMNINQKVKEWSYIADFESLRVRSGFFLEKVTCFILDIFCGSLRHEGLSFKKGDGVDYPLKKTIPDFDFVFREIEMKKKDESTGNIKKYIYYKLDICTNEDEVITEDFLKEINKFKSSTYEEIISFPLLCSPKNWSLSKRGGYLLNGVTLQENDFINLLFPYKVNYPLFHAKDRYSTMDVYFDSYWDCINYLQSFPFVFDKTLFSLNLKLLEKVDVFEISPELYRNSKNIERSVESYKKVLKHLNKKISNYYSYISDILVLLYTYIVTPLNMYISDKQVKELNRILLSLLRQEKSKFVEINFALLRGFFGMIKKTEKEFEDSLSKLLKEPEIERIWVKYKKVESLLLSLRAKREELNKKIVKYEEGNRISLYINSFIGLMEKERVSYLYYALYNDFRTRFYYYSILSPHLKEVRFLLKSGYEVPWEDTTVNYLKVAFVRLKLNTRASDDHCVVYFDKVYYSEFIEPFLVLDISESEIIGLAGKVKSKDRAEFLEILYELIRYYRFVKRYPGQQYCSGFLLGFDATSSCYQIGFSLIHLFHDVSDIQYWLDLVNLKPNTSKDYIRTIYLGAPVRNISYY